MGKLKGFYTDSEGRKRPITARTGRTPNTPNIETRKLEWKNPREYNFDFEYSDGKHEKGTTIADDPEEALEKAMDERKRTDDIPVGVKCHNSALGAVVVPALAQTLPYLAKYAGEKMTERERKKLYRKEMKLRRKAYNAVVERKIDAYVAKNHPLFRPTASERPELYTASEKEIRDEMRRRGYFEALKFKREESKIRQRGIREEWARTREAAGRYAESVRRRFNPPEETGLESLEQMEEQ